MLGLSEVKKTSFKTHVMSLVSFMNANPGKFENMDKNNALIALKEIIKDMYLFKPLGGWFIAL